MAAALGDAELIQTLLNAGADPNERNQNGATALMMAAEHNHISLVRVLLHNPKTQVNVKDSLSRDALSYSAARGNLEVFALLLTFGGLIWRKILQPPPISIHCLWPLARATIPSASSSSNSA